MSTPSRRPENPAEVPEAVRALLDGHGRRCGCSGQCERNHAGGRCDAAELASLTVAPADLTIRPERAAVLPADELLMWCHRCRDLAYTAARRRRRERVDQELAEAQLGLWGAA